MAQTPSTQGKLLLAPQERASVPSALALCPGSALAVPVSHPTCVPVNTTQPRASGTESPKHGHRSPPLTSH